MRLSGRSVIAGYARTWGVIAGIAGLAGWGGTMGLITGVFGVSLAALSWAWKDVTSAEARRRSDLNDLAFGTRCEPKLLPAEVATALEIETKRRWALLSDGQSPSDVARFGAEDIKKAAAAYGVLRLTALSLPSAQAAEAERDARRIAEGLREDRQLDEGGPYRSQAIDDRLIPEQPAKR
jgi:hypothetical protein